MERLFLDANVLFAASYREGAGLARLWTLRNVELVTSDYAFEEARRNLDRADQRARLFDLGKKMTILRDCTAFEALPSNVNLPDKDRPILQAAIHACAAYLLTLDEQHFGDLYGKCIGNVHIIHPRQFLDMHV